MFNRMSPKPNLRKFKKVRKILNKLGDRMCDNCDKCELKDICTQYDKYIDSAWLGIDTMIMVLEGEYEIMKK